MENGGSGTDISILTLADARGDEAGAIQAHDASYILKSVVFARDEAAGGPSSDSTGAGFYAEFASSGTSTVQLLGDEFRANMAKDGYGGDGGFGSGTVVIGTTAGGGGLTPGCRCSCGSGLTNHCAIEDRSEQRPEWERH